MFELKTPESIARYVFAGNAIFTLRSKKSGAHLILKVTRAPPRGVTHGDDPGRPWFVSFLSVSVGVDERWCYLGPIFPWKTARLCMHSGSLVSPADPVAVSAAWFFRHLAGARQGRPTALGDIRVTHDGRCSHCSRRLTDPKSLAAGVGPECAGKELRQARALAFNLSTNEVCCL